MEEITAEGAAAVADWAAEYGEGAVLSELYLAGRILYSHESIEGCCSEQDWIKDMSARLAKRKEGGG